MSDERLAELQRLLTDWRGANIRLRKEVEELRAQFAVAQSEIDAVRTTQEHWKQSALTAIRECDEARATSLNADKKKLATTETRITTLEAALRTLREWLRADRWRIGTQWGEMVNVITAALAEDAAPAPTTGRCLSCGVVCRGTYCTLACTMEGGTPTVADAEREAIERVVRAAYRERDVVGQVSDELLDALAALDAIRAKSDKVAP